MVNPELLPDAMNTIADHVDDLKARLAIAEEKLRLIAAKLDAYAVSLDGKKYSKMSTEELATDGLAAMITLHGIGEVLARKGGV